MRRGGCWEPTPASSATPWASGGGLGCPPADNSVVLSDNGGLFARSLTARSLNLIPCGRLEGPVRLGAKIRYRMAEQPCAVEQTGPDTVRVTFDRPQRAVTPGQSVVFYDGDTVVGGAVIEKGETS